jgi:hypothetical protein
MSGQETLLPFEFVCEFPERGGYDQIPPHMQEAIRRYVVQGIAPGHFLQGVISNDLRMAVNHADSTNLPLLKLYAQWFYNVAPSGCHGNLANMLKWISERQRDAEST